MVLVEYKTASGDITFDWQTRHVRIVQKQMVEFGWPYLKSVVGATMIQVVTQTRHQ